MILKEIIKKANLISNRVVIEETNCIQLLYKNRLTMMLLCDVATILCDVATIIISGGIDSIQKHNIKSNIYHSNWNEKEN